MFKFGQRYTANNYKLIYFQPSIENLKMYILQMEQDFDGHYFFFKNFLDKMGCHNASQLFNNPSYNPEHFFLLIEEIFDCVLPDYLIGIKNVVTGEIDYKFHCGICDYRPEEGYAILEKYSDNMGIYEGNLTCYRIFSLKTGKDLINDFTETMSGIKNLRFIASRTYPNNEYPEVYRIDVGTETIHENLDAAEPYFETLPEPNNAQIDIETIDNDDFYKLDESFINYMERNGQAA
jgi:hypothetical protein